MEGISVDRKKTSQILAFKVERKIRMKESEIHFITDVTLNGTVILTTEETNKVPRKKLYCGWDETFISCSGRTSNAEAKIDL